METAKPEYGFTENRGAEVVEFSVTPKPMPAGVAFLGRMTNAGAASGGFLVALLVLSILGAGGLFLWLASLAVAVVIYRKLRRDSQARIEPMYATTVIRVSKAGLARNGAPLYERAHIRGLWVNGPEGDIDTPAPAPTTVIVGTGMTGAAVALGEKANQAGREAGGIIVRTMLRKAAEQSYWVMIGYAARDVPLAQQLEKGVALALVQRIDLALASTA